MSTPLPPDDSPPPPQPISERAFVLRAAGLVGAAVLLSRIVGLVREIVTRALLGVTTIDATAFDIAKTIPEAIFLIIAGGAIGSAFIPTFTAYFERDDEAGAWHLFSAVINLLTLAVTAIAVLAMIFAPEIVTFFYAPAIATAPELLGTAVSLMRVMLLSPIIFGASGVIMGALNARQHFLYPALAPTVYNLGIIGGALLFARTPIGAAMGLAIGSVAGALGHLLIQIPTLRNKGARYTFTLDIADPGVLQVGKLMAPRVLGLSFSEINKFIMLYLTGAMPLGSLPALNAALRLIILPQGILGQALGIAAFPTLSTLAARQDYEQMRTIIGDSLRLLLFLGLPVTVWFMLLAEPIITVLFQRGLFDAESTRLVANALQLLALGLVALLFLEVIARSFYSLSDTLTPVLAGGAQVAAMALLSLTLRDTIFAVRGWPPPGALALAFSLSNYVEVVLLLWLLRRKLGSLHGRAFVNGAWRMAVAAGLMAGGTWLLLQQIPQTAVWIRLLAGLGAGGLFYILACLLLRLPELQQVLAYGRARLSRR